MTVLESDGVLRNPKDLNARSSLAWAATLAMNGLQDCGRSNAGFPAHWIQHAVGVATDSSHGEGLAVIQPAWLEHVNKKNPGKFAQFAERVFAIPRSPDISDEEYGLAGIQALRSRFKSWGMPSNLRDLGVKTEMLPTIVDSIMDSPETYTFVRAELAQILDSWL